MSIASEITRLQNVRSDLISAIESKNIEVSANAKFADLSTYINQIGDYSVVNCSAVPNICVIDKNGYIGEIIDGFLPKFPYNNKAIVINSENFSARGLGQTETVVTSTGTTAIGDRTYKTISINDRMWLGENLNLSDSGITEGLTSKPADITEPASFYYYDDEATYSSFGRLYNGYAMLYLEENKSTLFPGWRIPTSADYAELMHLMDGPDGPSANLRYGGINCATKMKKNDSTLWSGINGVGLWDFNVIPAGERSVANTGTGAYKNGIVPNKSNAASTLWSITLQQGTGHQRKFVNPWIDNNNGQPGMGNNFIYNAYPIRLINDI